MKRAKETQRVCANPLFEKWLVEWRTEAKLKGSNVEHHFTKAITSLRKYPLRLESGRDCILLQHFGTKLCSMLDRKLKSHNEGRQRIHRYDTKPVDTCDDVEHDLSPKKSRSLDGTRISTDLESQKNLRQKTSPIRRRRAHSISSSDSDGPDSPASEIPNIDDECETVNARGKKPLEQPRERPKTVRKLKNDAAARENNSAGIDSMKNGAESTGNLIGDEFRMSPNNFDVLLLVDIHETGSAKTKSKDDATKSELDRLSTPYEVRHLKIGDFTWIARCRNTNRELILPYIVERKRMDDLASSIKDGRFHEQKFRLKQSGIPNLIYMVESHGKNQHIGMPMPALLQASTNSSVQDGFTVKFTDSHRDSMRYLSILTTLIHKIYRTKTIVSSKKEHLETASNLSDEVSLMEFTEFNKAASKVKTFKVKEMFVRQLLQLKGLSLEKVLSIVEHYPTPLLLAKAFEAAGTEAENLLSTIKVDATKRQLGPALSKTVYEFYTRSRLE